MNDYLCVPFSSDEVRLGIFDMHLSKASGPDGFTALFYQKFWPVIGQDVTKEVLSILNDQGDISYWNSTIITQIPKIREPDSLKDFSPISLCNISYEIVARMIINRFSSVLSSVIDEHQSTFVPGRLIFDNVVVVFEYMNWIINKQKDKTGYLALKLDMSKAYDRVEWSYLKALTIKMGFPDRWVALIMTCVISEIFIQN